MSNNPLLTEQLSTILLERGINSVDDLVNHWEELSKAGFTEANFTRIYQSLASAEESSSTSSVRVRTYRSHDYARVEELRQYLAGNTASPEGLGTLAEEALCEVAVLDRKIIGYVLHEEDSGATQIREIVVDESYRGRGVMEALLSRTETENPLVLRVNVHNSHALRAFQRYGFDQVDTEGDYHILQKVPGSIIDLF